MSTKNKELKKTKKNKFTLNKEKYVNLSLSIDCDDDFKIDGHPTLYQRITVLKEELSVASLINYLVELNYSSSTGKENKLTAFKEFIQSEYFKESVEQFLTAYAKGEPEELSVGGNHTVDLYFIKDGH